MQFNLTVLVALAAVAIAGCSNDGSRGPTSPVRSPRLTLAGEPCSLELHEQADQERLALFEGETLEEAQALFAPVATDCPINIDQAREEMLVYIQFTIDALRAGNVKEPDPEEFDSKEDALVSHWNTMFAFVDYPEPNLPGSVLGPDGAAGVVFQTSANHEVAATNAAITVATQDANGDQRGHLLTIGPDDEGCLTGSNLIQTGPCFQFTSNPKAAPAFSPKAKLGICQPVSEAEPIPGLAPALGHLEEDVTKVADVLGVPYPSFCEDLPSEKVGSWTGGFGDIARRLAWVTKQALGVKSLYGSHGGLGGVSGGLSLFNGLDRMVFKATFTSTPGLPPGPPEAGTWFLDVKKPGSITVEKSLGDLLNSPVVLNQGGGACKNCGGLEMRGTLTGADGLFPTDGVYLVSWLSVETKTTKGSPIILRSSTGLEIARVTYLTSSGKEQLLYNGVVIGSWIKGKSQKFDVTVNLNNHTTSLKIDGVVIPAARNVPFVEDAQDLGRIAVELAGNDPGILGWDDITLLRSPDQ
jgi:hypothetical protein